MRVRTLTICATVAVGALATFTYHACSDIYAQQRRAVAAELSGMSFPTYEAQKVVYHIDEAEGYFDHRYRSVLNSVRNHVNAVGPGNIDLRVVLQGKGLNLLEKANSPGDIQDLVNQLRGKGVKFLICRNSLVETGTEPAALYGIKPEDIVQAAVAEIAALQARGYVYLHL